jgi:hypothetical protein
MKHEVLYKESEVEWHNMRLVMGIGNQAAKLKIFETKAFPSGGALLSCRPEKGESK